MDIRVFSSCSRIVEAGMLCNPSRVVLPRTPSPDLEAAIIPIAPSPRAYFQICVCLRGSSSYSSQTALYSRSTAPMFAYASCDSSSTRAKASNMYFSWEDRALMYSPRSVGYTLPAAFRTWSVETCFAVSESAYLPARQRSSIEYRASPLWPRYVGDELNCFI